MLGGNGLPGRLSGRRVAVRSFSSQTPSVRSPKRTEALAELVQTSEIDPEMRHETEERRQSSPLLLPQLDGYVLLVLSRPNDDDRFDEVHEFRAEFLQGEAEEKELEDVLVWCDVETGYEVVAGGRSARRLLSIDSLERSSKVAVKVIELVCKVVLDALEDGDRFAGLKLRVDGAGTQLAMLEEGHAKLAEGVLALGL